MGFINLINEKPVHLVLAKDRVRSIKRGHPWIFPEVLRDLPQAPPGSIALIKDKEGEILAKGYYDPGSKLAFRTLAVGRDRLDERLLGARLTKALTLRRRLFPDPSTTNGFRLINGEGDGLPGLVVDVYAHCAVMKLDGAGAEAFYNVNEIAAWLMKEVLPHTTAPSTCPATLSQALPSASQSTGGAIEGKKQQGGKVVRGGGGGRPAVPCVFLKFRSGDEAGRGRLVAGEMPEDPPVFNENGARFHVDIVQGQKTGFFLDQRENRARISRIVHPKARVLNVFGYTGGFSIYAGRGGAAHVTTVDLAKPACDAAEVNWQLNGLPAERHEAQAADAFQFLESAVKSKERWDVVVVDPPSFAPNKQSVERAVVSYTRVFQLAAQVTREGGVLALASCSSHIPSPMFGELCEEAITRGARRQAYVLGVHGQPEDHPYPIACEELRYLKFNMYQMAEV